MPLAIVVLAAMLAIGAAAAVAMWSKILTWSKDHLRAWLQARYPALVPYLDDALVELDKVSVAMRRTAKQAWREIRAKLLKQVTRLERVSKDEWLVTVTSWLREVVPDAADQVVQRVTEERVPWDDLPDDVRVAYLRKNDAMREVNVTRLRDQQFDELDLMD